MNFVKNKLRYTTAIILLFSSAIFSCTPEKLNEKEAVDVAEKLLVTLNEERYNEISAFCTNSFNTGETEEKRKLKYMELKNVLGNMQNFELLNTEHLTNMAEPAYIILTYKVVYQNAITQEIFTITQEDGNYKISDHNLRTENTL